jgi:hypothetical protein
MPQSLPEWGGLPRLAAAVTNFREASALVPPVDSDEPPERKSEQLPAARSQARSRRSTRRSYPLLYTGTLTAMQLGITCGRRVFPTAPPRWCARSPSFGQQARQHDARIRIRPPGDQVSGLLGF